MEKDSSRIFNGYHLFAILGSLTGTVNGLFFLIFTKKDLGLSIVCGLLCGGLVTATFAIGLVYETKENGIRIVSDTLIAGISIIVAMVIGGSLTLDTQTDARSICMLIFFINIVVVILLNNLVRSKLHL